jgi:hypothetical protein
MPAKASGSDCDTKQLFLGRVLNEDQTINGVQSRPRIIFELDTRRPTAPIHLKHPAQAVWIGFQCNERARTQFPLHMGFLYTAPLTIFLGFGA